MISYIPEIYPDELVYSWFCRLYIHAGYLTHKAALSDLFEKRSCNPSKEFIGHLNTEAKSIISMVIPIKELVIRHTMFPQYARFISADKKAAQETIERCDKLVESAEAVAAKLKKNAQSQIKKAAKKLDKVKTDPQEAEKLLQQLIRELS